MEEKGGGSDVEGCWLTHSKLLSNIIENKHFLLGMKGLFQACDKSFKTSFIFGNLFKCKDYLPVSLVSTE